MQKRLDTSTSSFSNLITEGKLYVDKTDYIWKLLDSKVTCCFMARPRRFGKSLTVSTLEAVFSGRKELFQGLALYDKPYDWKAYPIIHLSLGDCGKVTPELLQQYLYLKLDGICRQFQLEAVLERKLPGLSFGNVIRALHKQGPVVILIDEYDKPLLENLDSPDVSGLLDVLKEFYSAIKDKVEYERFVFVTGVSKFCHVSFFSGMNNLLDISHDGQYATMMGYTQAEVEDNFREWIAKTSAALAMPRGELLEKVRLWYNGFRFADDSPTVYNPVSLGCFFNDGGKFRNYWYATGTTSALLAAMRRMKYDLPAKMDMPVFNDLFDSIELNHLDLQKLMYQTGYLTIKKTKILTLATGFENRQYSLGYPNLEVEYSFNYILMQYYRRQCQP